MYCCQSERKFGMPAPFLHGSRPPESLSQKIQDLAIQFSNVAGVLSEQHDTLNNATNGLLDGTCPWQGKGASAFSDAWLAFGSYMTALQKSCEDTYMALHKLSGQIADAESQQAWDTLMTIVGGIATVISFAATISELGLNPLADGLLASTIGFTEQEGASVLNISEDITQADTTAATEFQMIESDLTASPTLAGNSSDVTGTPGAISPTNIDNMTTTDDLTGNGGGDDGVVTDGTTTHFFQTYTEDDGKGSGVSPLGEKYLQAIEGKGVTVIDSSDPDTRGYMRSKMARGDTWFNGIPGEDAGPDTTTVLLGPNVNDAAIYEEYLHVENGEARGWIGLSEEDAWTEEIRVETQVLSKADELRMTTVEREGLQQSIEIYRNNLLDKYGRIVP
jgi:uncharacterized protein YukE